MNSKNTILQALRNNQPSFNDTLPLTERLKVVNLTDTSPEGLQARFIMEAEKLSCTVYPAEDANAALNIMLQIIGDDKQVLAWDDSTLPFPIVDALANKGVAIASTDDAHVQIGITGVDAALAGTGSLIVQTKRGQFRAASLLPDHHVALVKRSQIIADFETWIQHQRDTGLDAFKQSSNTVIISGPSKTADIAQELIKGAHGPRKVHIILLD